MIESNETHLCLICFLTAVEELVKSLLPPDWSRPFRRTQLVHRRIAVEPLQSDLSLDLYMISNSLEFMTVLGHSIRYISFVQTLTFLCARLIIT